jgi:hypothetical protein
MSYGKHYVRRDEIKTQHANIKHKVQCAAGQMRARCISKSESTDACQRHAYYTTCSEIERQATMCAVDCMQAANSYRYRRRKSCITKSQATAVRNAPARLQGSDTASRATTHDRKLPHTIGIAQHYTRLLHARKQE